MTGMEKLITKGSASWLKLLRGKHLLLALFTGGIWLIVPFLQVKNDQHKLTSERITHTQGIQKRKRELELYQVKGINYTQSFMQRMLGIGNVMVNDHSSHIELKDIKDPEGMKEQIRSAVQSARYDMGVTYQQRL
jgi:uncharacterized membrane protein YdbT with pleckstrin-like domain